MNITEAKQILEALLFVNVTPLKTEKICQIMEIDQKTITILIEEMNKEYAANSHSFSVREIAGGYQMFTRPQYARWIRQLFITSQDTRLSPASIETLAIVAYKQPITRLEIEDIRGVSVSYILKNLLEKKLIMMAGRKQEAGRPILYRTTPFFLSYFGLKDISEMPQPQEFKDLLSPSETPAQE